jgi:hypothetical protein
VWQARAGCRIGQNDKARPVAGWSGHTLCAACRSEKRSVGEIISKILCVLAGVFSATRVLYSSANQAAVAGMCHNRSRHMPLNLELIVVGLLRFGSAKAVTCINVSISLRQQWSSRDQR